MKAPPVSFAEIDEPLHRELSLADWDRLWRRFLHWIEGRVSRRELERLRRAPVGRRGELLRMHCRLEGDDAWKFANCFEALACEMEQAFTPRPARQPTAARPGSVEKIAVLAARAQAGESLYHPDDESIPLWTDELL